MAAPDTTVAFASFTAATLGHQVLALTSSTLKWAATTFRLEAAALTLTRSEQVPREILPIYSLDQVSWHADYNDCWVVIYDKVYDITSFMSEHPGGVDVMMEYAGRDATLAFRSVGHSQDAMEDLHKYLIGILPPEERMYILSDK